MSTIWKSKRARRCISWSDEQVSLLGNLQKIRDLTGARSPMKRSLHIGAVKNNVNFAYP